MKHTQTSPPKSIHFFCTTRLAWKFSWASMVAHPWSLSPTLHHPATRWQHPSYVQCAARAMNHHSSMMAKSYLLGYDHFFTSISSIFCGTSYEIHDMMQTHPRRQFPLILAWAITVHKSQGLTLARATFNPGEDESHCGVTFVALTRVRHPMHFAFSRVVATSLNRWFQK